MCSEVRPVWAAQRQGLLMIFDSRQAEGLKAHRGLVQLLKEKRAEAHFAGLELETQISVYDRAVPAHAQALQQLGLAQTSLPALCLVQLNGQGIPSKVLWKGPYTSPVVVMTSLDQHLGIADRNRPKRPPRLLVVGSPEDGAYMEAYNKLKTLLASDWKGANVESLNGTLGLDGLTPPCLALLDPERQTLLWSKDLQSPDSSLQALAYRLGLVYKVPEVLQWERDGSTLLRVPCSLLTLGSDESSRPEDCRPRHSLRPEYPYLYLGRTEVTVGQFRRFCQATGYQTDAEKAGRSFVFQGRGFAPLAGANWRNPKGNGQGPPEEAPVSHITLNDAAAYSKWAGLRLPSEAEWEQAAGGRTFPWGEHWDPKLCRNSFGLPLGGSGGPLAVGSFPGGASPWGLLDMAGNVYEWTSSTYEPYPGGNRNSRMNNLRKVVRGGSFGNDEASDFYTTTRTAVGSQDATEAQGFRVCLTGTRLTR